MQNQITKLSELTHLDSFIQLDIVNGFKFIDKTGEIIALYADKNKPNVTSVSVNGVEFIKPIPAISQFRIAPYQIWAHFSSPDTLQVVIDNFCTQLSKIIKIIDVSKATKYSWRNQFVYEFKNIEEFKRIENKLKPIVGDTFVSQTSIKKYENTDINVNITIQIVEITESKENNKALLIDYDMYIKKDISILNEVNNISRKFSKNLSESFISIVNQILN
jgi:hypothetical protein